VWCADFGTISVKRGQRFQHKNSTASSSQLGGDTPASTTSSSSNPNSHSNFGNGNNANKFHDAAHHASNTWSSMDPFVAYDGFYLPGSSSSLDHHQHNSQQQHQQQVPVGGVNPSGADQSGGLHNFGLPGAAGNFSWPNLATMDIDQDWNWFTDDMTGQMPMGGGGIGGGVPMFNVAA